VFKPAPLKGGVIETIGDFFAYDSGFVGGVRIATADIDGDGSAEILTAPGVGGGPHVKVFKLEGLLVNPNSMMDFMAGNPDSRNGLFITGGNFSGDKRDEIVIGSGAGTPVVRIYGLGVDGAFGISRQFAARGGPTPGLVLDQDTNLDGTRIDPGFPDSLIPPAVPPKELPITVNGPTPRQLNGYQYGVRVATQDLNNDGIGDLILGAGPNEKPTVSLVNGSTFGEFRNYQAFENFFYGGVFVGGSGDSINPA
jgi:hypothetical protein